LFARLLGDHGGTSCNGVLHSPTTIQKIIKFGSTGAGV
jgi:hypothetical protein